MNSYLPCKTVAKGVATDSLNHSGFRFFYIVYQPARGSGESAIWRQDHNRLQGADRNITDKKLLIKNRLQIIFLVNKFCHNIAFTKDNQ